LNILQGISSSLEWTATVLPSGELGTQLLCKIGRLANIILTEIKIK